MSKKTIQSVSVVTKDIKLAILRKEYVLEHWPAFINCFPGSPGYVSEGAFEQKALDMLKLGIEAQVSVTGSPWDPEDLDNLASRPTKDFLMHLKSGYNRTQLVDTWRTVRDHLVMDMEG